MCNCNNNWPGLLNLFTRRTCGCGNNGRSGNNGCGCNGNNGRQGNNGNNGCGCNGNNPINNNSCWCYDAYYAAQYALNNNCCGCNGNNGISNDFTLLNGFSTISSGGCGCSTCNNCNTCNGFNSNF